MCTLAIEVVVKAMPKLRERGSSAKRERERETGTETWITVQLKRKLKEKVKVEIMRKMVILKVRGKEMEREKMTLY